MEYGWTLPKRMEHLTSLMQNSKPLYKQPVDFQGTQMYLDVWRIPIELPKYRLANGRTTSLQLEWLTKNPDKKEDFFKADPENEEAQIAQHGLLKKLMKAKDLYPYFVDTNNKQKDYIILDNRGFVVNGNRRLCTWRELLEKDSEKYNHFKWISVIVLPEANEQAIDKLEGELQIAPDIKEDYEWHAKANMYYDRIQNHILDIRSMATIYQTKESDIKTLLDMRLYAIDYLTTRGKKGQWSLVTNKDYAFKQLIKYRKKIKDASIGRLFETQCYLLMDDPTVLGERIYDAITKLYKHLTFTTGELMNVFETDVERQKIPIDNNPKNDDDIGELIDEQDPIQDNEVLTSVIDNPENRELAVEVIVDAIESQEAKEKDQDSKQYVLNQLQSANKSVNNALSGISKRGASKESVLDTIENIEESLASIKEWAK